MSYPNTPSTSLPRAFEHRATGLRSAIATGLLCLGACLSQAVLAEDLQLAWDPVNSSQLGGYELQYRLASGTYDNQIDAGSNTSSTVAGLQAGQTYDFRVRAYSTDRSEWSGFYNVVTKTNAGGTTDEGG